MSFADRVIRITGGEKISTIDLEPTDPSVLASMTVRLSPDMDTVKIRKPRASSLYKACMRMHVLATRFKKSKKSVVGLKSKLTYGFGNAIHGWVQNTPDIFGDRRLGWWQCLACGKIMYFGTPPKKACRHCGAHQRAARYFEHFMDLSDPYPATSHADLFIKHSSGVNRVIELKTISGDQFPKLKSPVIDHVWQLVLSMWGSNFDKNLPIKVDRKLGYVIYFSKKEHADMFPIKMFPVPAEPALVRRIKKKLVLYREGMADFPKSLPPPDSTCAKSNFTNYKSRSCPTRKECLKYG